MRKRKSNTQMLKPSTSDFPHEDPVIPAGNGRSSASRLNPRHQAMIREKIRGSLLITRLQAFALDEKLKNGSGREVKVKMTGDQVRAAFGLLAKIVPDLNRTEIVGDPNFPVELAVRKAEELARLEDPVESASEYQQLIGALH